MAERFINPLESQPLVNSVVQAPRLNHQYGATQKMGQDISNSLLKVYEESKVNLKNSYLSDYMKDINEFESKMQYDKSYYQDPTKIAELKEKLRTKQLEFRKMAEELEFFPEDMEDITSKTDTLNLRVDTAYKTKYTQWREQELKEDFVANQFQKAQNNKTNMMLGYGKEAVDGLHNDIKSYENGIDNDYLTEEQAIKNSLSDRLDLITANVMSYAEKPDAMNAYQQMANMTFEEFRENYKDMIFKLKGKEYDFTEMEYEAFKRSISSGLRSANARKNAEELNSKVQQGKDLKKRQEEPVETALNDFRVSADERIADRPDAIIGALNNKNTTDYKITGNWEEDVRMLETLNDLGYKIPTIDKNKYFYQVDIINNSEYIAEGMFGLYKDYQEVALGFPDELAENIMNSRTEFKDYDVPVGYRMEKAYMQSGATQSLVDSIYTPQNKQIIKNNKDVGFNVLSQMELFESNEVETDYTRMGDFGTVIALGHDLSTKYNMTLAGNMQALKLNANNSVNNERLFLDANKLLNDTALIMIYEKTGGIVPSEFLDIGKDLIEGSTFDNIDSKSKKAKVYHLITQDEDFQKELIQRVAPAFKEITAGLGFLDVGNGQMLIVNEKYNQEIEAKGIRNYIQHNKFRTKEGLVVPTKEVKAKGYLNKDSCTFTYQGQPLYVDGQTAVYTFGQGEKQ